MFKPKPSLTKPAERRLQKATIKRQRTAKIQKAEFLAQVSVTSSSSESQRTAQELVARVRAAKSAGFLQQYRSAA